MAAVERAAQALELRRSGYSYRQIAAELGVSVGAAHSHVMKALATARAKLSESAAIVTRLELERLDSLLVAAWPAAEKGDTPSIMAALKISERRMRILGIERERVEHSGPNGGPIETVSGYDKIEALLDKYAEKAEEKSHATQTQAARSLGLRG